MSAVVPGILTVLVQFCLSYAAPVLWNFAIFNTRHFWLVYGTKQSHVTAAWGRVVGARFIWRSALPVRSSIDQRFSPAVFGQT